MWMDCWKLIFVDSHPLNKYSFLTVVTNSLKTFRLLLKCKTILEKLFNKKRKRDKCLPYQFPIPLVFLTEQS